MKCFAILRFLSFLKIASSQTDGIDGIGLLQMSAKTSVHAKREIKAIANSSTQSVDMHSPVRSCQKFMTFAGGRHRKIVPVTSENIVFRSGKVLVVRHSYLHSLVFLRDSDDGRCHEESTVQCSKTQTPLSLASTVDSVCKYPCVADSKPHLSMFRTMISGALHARNAKISRALMLGLGAGALPLWFSDNMPGTDFHAVDINGDVVRAAPCFGLHESPTMHVSKDDGIEFLHKQQSESFDVIFVDVFDGEHVPAPFLSPDFFATMKRKLSPEGLIVMDFYSANIKEVLLAARSNFPNDMIYVGKSPGLDNMVLLAGGLPEHRRAGKFDLDEVSEWLARASFSRSTSKTRY